MSFGPTQMFGAAGALAFAGFAAVIAQGCTVLANDEPTCPECQHQACIGQWAVCGSDAECMAIYTCATAATCDQSCVDQCYLAHPAGQLAYYALASCDAQALRGTTCGPLCPAQQSNIDSGASSTDDGATSDASVTVDASDDGSDDASDDGSFADSATPDASTPVDSGSVQSCTDCTDSSCASEKSACASGTACDTYTNCLGACADANCVTTCGTTYADGKNASNALGTCVTTRCSAPCGLMQ